MLFRANAEGRLRRAFCNRGTFAAVVEMAGEVESGRVARRLQDPYRQA